MLISRHGEKKVDNIKKIEKIEFLIREILATHRTVLPYPAKWTLGKKTPGLSTGCGK